MRPKTSPASRCISVHCLSPRRPDTLQQSSRYRLCSAASAGMVAAGEMDVEWRSVHRPRAAPNITISAGVALGVRGLRTCRRRCRCSDQPGADSRVLTARPIASIAAHRQRHVRIGHASDQHIRQTVSRKLRRRDIPRDLRKPAHLLTGRSCRVRQRPRSISNRACFCLCKRRYSPCGVDRGRRAQRAPAGARGLSVSELLFDQNEKFLHPHTRR